MDYFSMTVTEYARPFKKHTYGDNRPRVKAWRKIGRHIYAGTQEDLIKLQADFKTQENAGRRFTFSELELYEPTRGELHRLKNPSRFCLDGVYCIASDVL